MSRITTAMLESLLDAINKKAGFDKPKYSEVGSYTLDWAYGGVKLEKFCNTGGGVVSITSGFVSKSELYYQMQAYISGFCANVN
jgi:hypothetical protein